MENQGNEMNLRYYFIKNKHNSWEWNSTNLNSFHTQMQTEMKINEIQSVFKMKTAPVVLFTQSHAWKGSPNSSYHNISLSNSNKFCVKISVFQSAFPVTLTFSMFFHGPHILKHLLLSCALILFDRRCSQPSFSLKG